jgi:hypothetical protein
VRSNPKGDQIPKKKTALDAMRWKWPTGWKSVHLPDDTREDFALEMELAEMMSAFEEENPEGYEELLKQQEPANPAN